MLFVSGKKYNEMIERKDGEITRLFKSIRALCKDVSDLLRLRTLDKQCIQALLDLLTRQGITPGVFEKSLVDQTLNQ